MIVLFRQRRGREELPAVRSQRYRPTRKSCIVHLEAVDEDFTVPSKRLRASAPSSESFRAVASGLSAAKEAMNQMSRVREKSRIEQPTRPPSGQDPALDSLAFDDWMETIVSI